MSQLASLFETYLDCSDLRPSTVRFKRQALKYFVEWFGSRGVTDVTPVTAETYRKLLAKGRSPVTANGYMANFKPFWKWLRENDYIKTNPFAHIKDYRVTREPPKTFTMAELGRLMRVSSLLQRIQNCFGLLGCRRGEMLHLHIRDINLDSAEPHLLLRPKKDGPTSIEWGLKSHAIRYVACPECMRFDGIVVELHKDIVQRAERLPSDQPYICMPEKYFRRLIAHRNAGTLTIERRLDPTLNFQRLFRALQWRAMISPTKRYHELRACFATVMIDPKRLGESRTATALGHASTQTTRMYDRKSQMSLIADISQIATNCYGT